tara:strand:+ start:247 stop:684 length:438 start_codon:yes stop_codon:yes gene_type:complete
MKLSLILGVLLLLLGASFFAYHSVMQAKLDRAAIELQTAINNQQVLESKIEEQNKTITQQINNMKKTQEQISKLSTQYNTSQQQVANLRNKFAKHNLEGMALAKPALLEGKINKATARVMVNLTSITNPDQFDEDSDNTSVATSN